MPVAEKQQNAGDQQGAAHHNGVRAQSLDEILDRHHGKQGQRADDDQQDHPAVGRHRRGRGALGQIVYTQEKFPDHILDIGPVGNKHGDQRAQVQQDVKGVVRAALDLQSQQVLRNGQMARTGDRQEFCHALDHAQEHCG